MQWRTIALDLCPSDLQALKEQHTRVILRLEEGLPLDPDVLHDLKTTLSVVINQNIDFQYVITEINRTAEDWTIQLVHKNPEILNLPWGIAVEQHSQLELAQIDHLYLAKSRPELLNPGSSSFEPRSAPPLKVLVMISSPEDSDFIKKISYEEEELEILKACSPLLTTGGVQLDFTDDGSLETLKTKVKHNNYHILHFSGHGFFKNGAGYFALEDPLNLKTRVVTASEFAEALCCASNLPIPLVILSACQTSPDAIANGLPEIAYQMLRTGITAVITIGAPVQDQNAAGFCARFYEELARGRKIPASFNAAVRHLKKSEGAANLGDPITATRVPLEWIFPNLYLGAFTNDLINWGVEREEIRPDSCRFGLEQNRLVLKPEIYYRFIGRRREKAAVLGHFFYKNPVLLRGRGGVGKTALAEHLAGRLMARDPKVHPFVFNEKANSIQEILDQLKNYLVEQGQSESLRTLSHLGKATEQLAFLLARLEQVCQPVFIFDSLETFQSEPGKAFAEKYQDLAMVIDYLCCTHKYYLILTCRYPVPEFKNLWSLDLNQVSFNDFWKKCNTLEIYRLQEPQPGSGEPLKVEAAPPLEALIMLLYEACGANYRALEFWDRLGAAHPGTGNELRRRLETFREAMATPRERISEHLGLNLVFAQLPSLLEPETRLILYLLAQFQLPVQSLALQMQVPEELIPFLHKTLQSLQELALVEVSLDRELNLPYYYVAPLVKDLLKFNDFKDGEVWFSPQKAGLYHYHHSENVVFTLVDLEAAFEYFCTSPDPAKVKELGDRISKIYYDLSLWQKAYYYCRQAYLLLNHDTGNSILSRLGQIFYLDGQYVQALSYFKKVLSDYQETGDQGGEGTTLNYISNVFYAKGDYDTALSYLEQSMKIQREIGDHRGLGGTLGSISQIYHAKGDHKQAVHHLQQSLSIHQEIGDPSGVGEALKCLGRIYGEQGNLNQALEHLEESLRIRQEIGDQSGAGAVLNQIGEIYKARGEYDTALKLLEQSLQICREIGDKGNEGTILNDISSIYYTKEDLDTALIYFDQSLRIYQEIGDKRGAGVILNNISQIYHAKGNYDTALGYLEESLRICQSNGDQRGVGAVLNNISRIYQAWGDYNTALDYLTQSLQISRDIGDKRGMISIFHNLAVVSLEKEEPQKYLEYALSGYSLALEINDAVGIYNVGRILGRMLCKVGMKREGIPILQKCLSVGQAAHLPDVGEIKDLLNEFQNLQ